MHVRRKEGEKGKIVVGLGAGVPNRLAPLAHVDQKAHDMRTTRGTRRHPRPVQFYTTACSIFDCVEIRQVRRELLRVVTVVRRPRLPRLPRLRRFHSLSHLPAACRGSQT